MRLHLALGVSVSAMLSCTAVNPAYGVSASGSMSATDTSSEGESTGAGSNSESNSDSNSDSTTKDETTATEPATATESETFGTTTGGGSSFECWSTPIYVSTGRPAGGATLSEIPLRVGVSDLEQPFDAKSLRFYQGGLLLPHELEEPGRIAWVRINELVTGSEVAAEIEAVMGPDCPEIMHPSPAEVWSAGYLAVFHFDDPESDPLTFVDSVHGIELLADANSELSPSASLLGSHLQKSGDGRLEGTNSVLDLNGSAHISTLGWVRLDDGQEGVLEWDEKLGFARHRELVAKLPGYRLNAVRGQVSPDFNPPAAPFFNLSAAPLSADQHDNTFGTTAVQPTSWTMLAGTFDGATLRLFVDGEFVSAEPAAYSPGSNETGTIRVGRWLHGGIDEIRISSVARSDTWIAIQHASMAEQLLTYGETVQHFR